MEGKTMPPKKPLDWLIAMANILPIKIAMIKPAPMVSEI
jgi:hypothetical protein